MNPLDIRTLQLVLGAVILTQGLCMASYRISRRTYPGFGWWTLGFLFVSAGLLLVGFRGVLPDIITIIIGNAFIYSALALYYIGFSHFLGIKKISFPAHLILALVLSFVIVPLFTYILPSVNTRIVIISFTAAVYFFLCNLEIVRANRKGFGVPAKQLIITLSLLTCLFLARGVFFSVSGKHN